MSLLDTAPGRPDHDRVTLLLDLLAKRAPVESLDCLHPQPGSNAPAPAWHSFIAATLDTLAVQHFGGDWASALINRLNELQTSLTRSVEENGVTYNLYSDAAGKQRPWSLDLFPMIVQQQDWERIERGVLQRVDLLNRILADVYGPQQLVRDGMLPSALVYGHPGYLRAAHGIEPPHGQHLHIAAFDLALGPDGNWWIMSQRTQAPSGLGYALENRMIVSRLFPDAFASLKVERLAESYKAFINSLSAHSPAGNDARIVLLTPGPYSETYFEHVYLARYLGLTLVEGGDLIVRNQKVYLKSLKGLEPVDVILRRLDDDFLDPLELRADSALGIPGMMQAYRAGNVVLANAPGSGFLESSATFGFLPLISERLLGEPLLLPSLASWWCGERSTLQTLLPQLQDYVIKPTFNDQSRRFVPMLGRSMSERERAQWIERINARPEDYSAQAYMPLAHMPTWRAQSQAAPIGSQAMMIRVFALSDGHGKWRVMPGGLTRIAPDGKEVVSMYRGGSSADLWAITGRTGSEEQRPSTSNIPQPILVARGAASVSSRAGENLYWLGRYTERLENTVRLARVILETLGSEVNSSPLSFEWLHRLAITNGLVSESVPPPRKAPHLFERSLIAALADHENPLGVGSVSGVLISLQHAAFAVRERLALEQWSLINTSINEFASMMSSEQRTPQQALRALERLSNNVMAMTGAQIDRMTRDDGWRLLSIGRQIERIATLSEALGEAFATQCVSDETGFALILNLFDSTITYRSRYRQLRDPQALLELLVFDHDNPRSLSWISETLAGRIKKMGNGTVHSLLPADAKPSLPHEWPENALLTLAQNQNYTEVAELLLNAQSTAHALAEAISQRYFTHAHTLHRTVGT